MSRLRANGGSSALRTVATRWPRRVALARPLNARCFFYGKGVVEWPQKGAAFRFFYGKGGPGWWVAKFRQNRGYMPLSGPWRTRDEALAHVEEFEGPFNAEVTEA